ncbi:hypothetical protein SBRCBS47491_007776 [Sporothrix bragantina]|uniref:Uncharacterized protein n=1 Tax=Sporothrix bragantina TaxID=671064 RepID=A0ABP0CH86_9PEZI
MPPSGQLSSSSSTSSSSPSNLPGHLSPTTYLERIGGGQTSAEHEIWDIAHRLYVYLATCQRENNLTRIEFFQRLVRLCIRHRGILLAGVESLENNNSVVLESCTTCSHREYSSSSSSGLSLRTTGHCCWFHPDEQARTFLRQLVALCDSWYMDLFNGSTRPAELSEMFTFA